MKACREGKLEDKDVPAQTEDLSRIRREMSEGLQARHDFFFRKKHTDFLRHVVGEVEEKGPKEDFLWWVAANR